MDTKLIGLFLLLFLAFPAHAQILSGIMNVQSGGVAANTYKTAFPATENPISQSGIWANGAAQGTNWSDCQTNGTSAYGAQASFGTANDSTCVLTNHTWGATQTVIASVYGTIANEVELRLRTTISSSSITGYEIVFTSGHSQVVRWDGAINNFTVIHTQSTTGANSGDVISATISGSTITVYINGVQVDQQVDATYTGGDPGMGFYCASSCTLASSALTNFVATDGTNTFAQFNPPVANCYGSASSGTTVACTLGLAPPAGSVVAVSVQTYPVLTLSTVKDNAGSPNTYTITPNSCSTANEATAGNACLAYFLPGSTGGATVTATVTGGTCGACSITADVFEASSGTISFDKDVKGLGGTGTVNSPSATPTQAGWSNDAGELFWGFCTNAVSCGSVTGSWTVEAHGGGTFGEQSEYQIHVESATAVGMTGTASQQYDSMIMAFKLTP